VSIKITKKKAKKKELFLGEWFYILVYKPMMPAHPKCTIKFTCKIQKSIWRIEGWKIRHFLFWMVYCTTL